jgi:hypothetical protein
MLGMDIALSLHLFDLIKHEFKSIELAFNLCRQVFR